jgi:hypothetical protein
MEQSIRIFRVWAILAGLCGIYIIQKSCQMIGHWFQCIAGKWETSIAENEKYLYAKMNMNLQEKDELFWPK